MTGPGNTRRTDPSRDDRWGGWIFQRRTIDGAFWGLVLLCAVLVFADFVFQWQAIVALSAFPVAYGIYGFVSFGFIVFAGKGLRKVIMRDEDYYDR